MVGRRTTEDVGLTWKGPTIFVSSDTHFAKRLERAPGRNNLGRRTCVTETPPVGQRGEGEGVYVDGKEYTTERDRFRQPEGTHLLRVLDTGPDGSREDDPSV